MKDRYATVKQRTLIARRDAEEKGNIVGVFSKAKVDDICANCKFPIGGYGGANRVARDGVAAFTHYSGAGCSNALNLWRESR